MSDLDAKEYIELLRLRAVNAALLEALELFAKQWNACGPNSDFGRYFGNVRIAAEAAIAHAHDQAGA
jgi:hypothetical protein